jgi:hypothetical protein
MIGSFRFSTQSTKKFFNGISLYLLIPNTSLRSLMDAGSIPSDNDVLRAAAAPTVLPSFAQPSISLFCSQTRY